MSLANIIILNDMYTFLESLIYVETLKHVQKIKPCQLGSIKIIFLSTVVSNQSWYKGDIDNDS